MIVMIVMIVMTVRRCVRPDRKPQQLQWLGGEGPGLQMAGRMGQPCWLSHGNAKAPYLKDNKRMTTRMCVPDPVAH
jgi:hypothetical protein